MEFKKIPLLQHKYCNVPTVFEPEHLLREARRQKSLPDGKVPKICILDPDGDIVRHLRSDGRAKLNPFWACYHTELYNFQNKGIEFGIVGCAVGGPFAVIVAEQLFASGCELLISITSAGQIVPAGSPPYFVLIDKALRDEGTSYHYLEPEKYADMNPELLGKLEGMLDQPGLTIKQGAVWTTDAPYRETEQAIESHRQEGILAVEMEAAALYAFATAKACSVICFAQITNRMGRNEGDFEKGAADGSLASLKVIQLAAKQWME
jgi:uridine phosphorylase